MTSTGSDLRQIKAQFAAYTAPSLQLAVTREAAVGLILRQNAGDVEVLFIQRAIAEQDPWSGQIAFPGGGRESTDRDLVDTAIRETLEETAVRIDRHSLSVHLMDQQGSNRGGAIDLLIRCYIFEVIGEIHPLPNYEVAEVFWTPVTHLQDRNNHLTFQPEITQTPAEGIDLGCGQTGQPRILWGLTYRFVQQFLSLL